MHTALHDDSPFPRPAAGAQPRIGFALTTAERRMFFSGSEPTSLPAQPHWFSESDLNAANWEPALREFSPTILVTGWRTPALPLAWLEDAACPLRYVCHVTGSVRSLLPRSFVARGGLVTNWGTLASLQVAEHALLLVLSALRNQGRWREYIARSPAERQLSDLDTRTLQGKRVGLHGFGGIAQALLPLLRPFGVHVRVFAPALTELITARQAEPCDSLQALFSSSDVLVECEALTPATAGIVSAALLARLPDGAVFVNIGRGALVDEAALISEARTGRIRFALDVVQDEPVTVTAPIARFPGAILSPHIGGPTLDRYADCGALALGNVRRFLAGEPLEALITTKVYDRST